MSSTVGSAEAAPLSAVVFDMDGVVTRTSSLHMRAWKQLFDDFLRDRPAAAGEDRRPFTERDYREHVDGKPRLDGVRAFLTSRGIELPRGTPRDAPSEDTVWALGQRKNALFRALVEREGVDVEESVVALARDLRARGVSVGIATSSRNAPLVLERAQLEALFDARVDGAVAADLELKGKPRPDIFVECARRLGASSPAGAVVIEDAASGVAAGRAGGFGLVIGVDRAGNAVRLREAGADWLVRDIAELSVDHLEAHWSGRRHARPNVLREWSRLGSDLRGRSLAVFLDYDGTLTPIVARPELAVLDEAMRATLARLSRAWPTYIVSGRGLEDVRALVGIETLWYAASHGYDLAAPEGTAGSRQIAPDLEPEIHAAAGELRAATRGVEGVIVEDKRFSIAVHYRLVEEGRVPVLERVVDDVVARHRGLKKAGGKKVFELRPAMDWDKGKALRWLLEATGREGAYPIYVGDDVTDEDAFDVLAERGLGVLVSDLPRPTAARYGLGDPEEVRVFLERLATLAEERS